MGRSSSRRWCSSHSQNPGALLLLAKAIIFLILEIDAEFCLGFEFSILGICVLQKCQNGVLDAFFSGLSCVVSVPFYTAFLPLLFWVSFLTSSST